MNVLILTSDSPYKNSGVVAKSLLDGLSAAPGSNVKLVVGKHGIYPDKSTTCINTSFERNIRKLSRKITGIFSNHKNSKNEKPITDPDYYVFDYDHTTLHYNTKTILKKTGFRPDAIIVLFMTKFLSFKNIYELNKSTSAPVFLYFMDMAPMTGGCHYAWDCKGYTRNCESCPAFLSSEHKDQAKTNLLYNQSYIKDANIIPVAGTEWQLRQLKESYLYKNSKKYKVILPIDEDEYFPGDKLLARRDLELPIDKKIIFFGAVFSNEKRKGFKQLMESLHFLKENLTNPSDIHLAIAGNHISEFEHQLPFPHTKLGYLDQKTFPKAFQAADIFVSPSIEDSGPMMVNQSIMSGTPVVAFEMGAALDLVHNNTTGYRAHLKDTRDFANGIKTIIELSALEYTKMSSNCRELGLKNFTYPIFFTAFNQILNEN